MPGYTVERGAKNRPEVTMAARNRASLKTPTEEPSTKSTTRSKPSRPTRRANLTRVAVQVASSDPTLTQFLKCPIKNTASNGSTDTDAAATASVKVERAIQSLGKLEAEVIAALFPSTGSEPESLDKLAVRLGMTVEEVKAVADDALRDLRGARSGGARISAIWN